MKPSDEIYRHVLDQLFDGVVFVDLERRITYWNKGAEKISGYSSQEVLGRHCEEVFNPADEEGNRLGENRCPALVAMKDEAQSEIDLYLSHKEGYRVPVRVRAVTLRNDLGKVIGAVEIFRDHSVFVAARHRTRELQRLTDLDALTHLGNRRFSEVNLSAALQTRLHEAEPFGVILIDVDDFKLVNDTFGKPVGDQMLKLVAETLQYSVRTSDYVGRWGGEEFLLVLYDVNEPQLKAIAEKLRRLVQHNSLITEKGEFGVTISVGGTLTHRDDTLTSLLERAEAALQQSKNEGKNRSTII